jgi:hypothetical protein
MRHLTFSLILMAFAIIAWSGCEKAQANVDTLISDDCGVSWKLIAPGNTIPSRIGPCALRTSIPSYPMAGESKFKTTFAANVKAEIDMDYEYVIADPILFIKDAKYLGKMSGDADDVAANDSRFESAENSIIDKRIKDCARDLLQDQDIVDFDNSDFEAKLIARANEALRPRGVLLNFLSFVPEPSEQVAQAIDVVSAMRIYKSKGLDTVGAIVIENKAGAARIITQQ